MGTSRSAGELGDKFARLAVAVPKANRGAVEQSALLGKEIMVAGAVSAGLKRDGKLAGAKWGARYDIKGAQNPSALLRYTGPVHWAFFGTAPHIIGARGLATRGQWRRRAANTAADGLVALVGGQRSRRRGLGDGRYGARKGARALRFRGDFAAYVMHPGTRGRNTWPATKKRIQAASVKTFREAHRNALIRSGFGR